MIMNKKQLILSVTALFVLMLCSCSSNDTNYVSKQLTVDSTIETISDSIYLGNLSSISIMDSKDLIVGDIMVGQIYNIDTLGCLINKIGLSGRGAREYGGASFHVDDSIIYVLDPSGARFQCFDFNGKFKETIWGKDLPMVFDLFQRFFIDDNKLVGKSMVGDSALVEVDIITKECKYFGQKAKGTTSFNGTTLNSKLILTSENNYISILRNIPFIEIFDKSTLNIVDSIDYSFTKRIKSTLSYIASRDLDENQSIAIVKDAYCSSDKLYVLVISYFEGTQSDNTVLSFQLQNNTIEFIEEYILPAAEYTSICGSDSLLIAFSSSEGRLEKFKI